MKKVFLDSLPHKGKLVDWMNSIGYKISFIYDDLQGELEIIGYDKIKHQCEILYNGNIVKIQTASLARGQISFAIGLKTHLYKYSIGQIVKTITGEIEITGYLKMYCSMRGYEYKCPKDGYVGKITEARLMDGVGCPVCSNKAVIKGINDIGTTNPEMVKYFKNIEDAFTHTYSSGEKVVMKCPKCGYEKKIAIYSLFQNGFSCICNDGISYPEKFVLNLLQQLNLKFEYQKSNFKWSKNKIYDFYIPALKCIIETHGEQHYSKNHNFSNLSGMNLSAIQENDKYKMQLAQRNGIKHYIAIDCRESTMNWIKNSIINSDLSILFDLHRVDWLKCHEYACKNIVKEVCDCWNNGEKIHAISNKFMINKVTVSRYLKQGDDLGWCDYSDARLTKIVCLNNLQIYNSIKDAKEKTKAIGLQDGNLIKCCIGERRYAGKLQDGTKLRWIYYKDFINNKNISFETHKRYKKVICLTTGIVFNSLTEAADYYNNCTAINTGNIARCCKGRCKYAGIDSQTGQKLVWQYYDEYLKKEAK